MFRLWRYSSEEAFEISAAQVFSTEFSDDDKSEEDAAGDDSVVFVAHEDGTFEGCYTR